MQDCIDAGKSPRHLRWSFHLLSKHCGFGLDDFKKYSDQILADIHAGVAPVKDTFFLKEFIPLV